APAGEGGAAAAPAGEGGAHQGRTKWRLLRQRWKLLGLFEVDQQHELYQLTSLMKEGLATACQGPPGENQPHPPVGLQAELSDQDYRSEVTHTHTAFAMTTFAGPVFASLRASLGISQQEYFQSLCWENCFLQFISNSKSSADFFLTNDKRFFLKTQKRREVRFLLDNLKTYVEHLRSYPHSLLVKFLGVHRIVVPCRWKRYFIVMLSVFYPDDRISARYDIKGCEVSRWTDPSPEGDQQVVVLKDLNFEGQFITLGQQRSWLLLQVDIDTTYLQRLNVVDYSLLLGQQTLQPDEQLQVLSLRTLIARTKSPVPGPVGPADLQAQNRRLLPDLKNPLHVIDGPEQRYFIGIIDIFTVYTFRKRLEHLWKTVRHPGRSFSTVSPQTYCLRLCDWIRDHSK
uniref:Phosphatidylinositol-4-phosphate 5-kinase like 1 n=1 Tax=Tetraodon nigroviridis TaxID=99883 RepID=H3C386_TETNG